MTQIVVTLEEGSNSNIIRSAINLIKGVKDTLITHTEITPSDSKKKSTKVDKRLHAFDQLAGCVSMNMIDTDDPRTGYLLSK